MRYVTLRLSLRFQPSKLKFCTVVSIKTVDSSTILLDTSFRLYIASQTKILIMSSCKLKMIHIVALLWHYRSFKSLLCLYSSLNLLCFFCFWRSILRVFSLDSCFMLVLSTWNSPFSSNSVWLRFIYHSDITEITFSEFNIQT